MDIHEQIRLIRERNKRIKDRNRKIREAREQYRIDLQEARQKYGWHVPFGVNLESENVVKYLESNGMKRKEEEE